MVAKPLGRDVGLVLGEQCGPKWQKIFRLERCAAPEDHLGEFSLNPDWDFKGFPLSILKEVLLVSCPEKWSNPSRISFRGFLLVLHIPQTSAGVCGEDEHKGFWSSSVPLSVALEKGLSVLVSTLS